MRNALVKSLSLAFGIVVSPAFAQDVRTAPAVRSARLGQPIEVATPVDPGLTPVGLLAPGPESIAAPAGLPVPQTQLPMPQMLVPPQSSPGIQVPTVPQVPAPTVPQVPPPQQLGMTPGGALTVPLNGLPLLPAPATPGSMPGAIQLPAPTPLPPPTPSVTETRTPGPSTIPMYPGYPATGGVPYQGPIVAPEAVYQPGVYQQGVYPPNGFDPCAEPDCPIPMGRSCCPNPWYAGAEFLMWWTRSMQVPTLLTTSAPSSNGILGAPTTRSLYGGDVGDTLHGGARFTVGRWFGDDCKWGVEGRFFFLGYDPSTYVANSSEYPVLARPFTNANTPMGPFSELIAYPGLSKGVGEITTQTQLWGAEANLRRVLIGNANAGGFELDAIVGYRYLELDEHLTDTEYFFRTPGSNMSIGTPAMSGSVYDSFHTTDVFHGGQIGLNASYTRGPWSIDGRALVAFGDLEQSAYINGNQTLYFANGTVTHTTGGLLALPNANIGTFHNSQFAVIPEVTLNVGYQITSHWRVFVGYDFLFLGNALRPGGTIDTTIDAARIPNFPLPGSPAPLPGASRPGPYFTTSDFFAQGINWGLQFRW